MKTENAPMDEGVRKRKRRTQQEVDLDAFRYQQLLLRDKELELDIPPRKKVRARGALKRAPEIVKKEPFEPKIESVRPEAPVTLRQTRSQTRNHHSSVPNVTQRVPVKPRFIYKSTPIMAPALRYKYQNMPPLIKDARQVRNFAHKVVVENSYKDLIRTIKNSAKDNVIDFGMHWSLLPKNFDLEKNRFSIVDEEAALALLKVWASSTPNNNTIFSDDIDLFFRTLSDSHRKEEYVKRSVPLV